MSYVLKLALFGTPGAGKSTASQLIEDYCRAESIEFHRIKLAYPLYEAQSFLYKLAGRPLDEFYTQDGELLSFLGGYLRRINPLVLVDQFAERLARLVADQSVHARERTVIVCDDMRRLDADALRDLGFVFVRVQ